MISPLGMRGKAIGFADRPVVPAVPRASRARRGPHSDRRTGASHRRRDTGLPVDQQRTVVPMSPWDAKQVPPAAGVPLRLLNARGFGFASREMSLWSADRNLETAAASTANWQGGLFFPRPWTLDTRR
jgi:hypothetical protein